MAATVKAGAKPRPRSVRDALPPPPGVPANHAPASAPSGPLRFTSADDGEGEREPLFYIDDVPYTIPVDPPASIGLGAQDILAEERDKLLAAGLDLQAATMTAMGLAQRHVLRKMLGDEGYQALIGYEKLKRTDLRRLMEVCSEKAYAALEEDDATPN